MPDVGKPKAEPPSALPSRVAALKEMLIAKQESGTLFDDLGEDGPEEDGTQFLNMGTITYTSKGVVNSKEEMPEGVPPGFPLIRRAANALAYSKNEGSNLKKYKQLYQDLLQNEKQWLEVRGLIVVPLEKCAFVLDNKVSRFQLSSLIIRPITSTYSRP